MAWWDLLILDAWATYLAVLAMFALAAILLVAGRDHPASNVFAALLVFRAASILTAVFRGVSSFFLSDSTAARFWGDVFPYFATAVPFLVLHFMMVYPRPRFAIYRTPWPLAATVAAVAALWWLHATWPDGWNTQSTTADGTLLVLPFGPMSWLLGATFALLGAAALLFVVEARRRSPGLAQTNLTLMALAFSLHAGFDGLSALAIATFHGFQGTPSEVGAFVGLAFVVAALIVAARSQLDAGLVFRFLNAHWLVVAAAVLMVLDSLDTSVLPVSDLSLLAVGVMRLTLPAIAAYALLRHGLFDIDIRAKFALRSGSLGTGLAAVFFVLSEGIEQALPVSGTVAGVASAGAVFIALRPLQLGANRLADRFLPGVDGSEKQLARRREELYRGVLDSAFRDGRITSREREILQRFRRELGVSDAQAKRWENQSRKAARQRQA